MSDLRSLVYGLPVLPLYFLYGPIAILQGIYAKYFGLSLTTIATVLFIARLFDAVSDPMIGYLADRYYARRGKRTPFIVTGGLLFIASSWFLYVPPDNVSAGYFLFWFLAFYFSYTLFEIPHMTWGGELAVESRERNKIYGLRSFFFFFGSLLFFAMPLLPLFETNEFTPETLKWSVITAGAIMLPVLYICIKIVPAGREQPTGNCPGYNRLSNKDQLLTIYRSVIRNKPLLALTAAHICTGFAAGLWMTILFIYVDAYLLLGEQFALLFVMSYGLSIVALKFWYVLANRTTKQTSWITGMVLVTVGMIGTGFLSPVSTGWPALLLCMTLVYGGFGAFNLLVPSLMSDIVDYGTWKFGTNRGATYFSLYTFINKSVAAVGGALALAVAGWYGFDPAANSHSETAIVGIRFITAWIPATVVLLSMVFIYGIAITPKRHAIIRRRLSTRSAAVSRNEKNASNSKDTISNRHYPSIVPKRTTI